MINVLIHIGSKPPSIFWRNALFLKKQFNAERFLLATDHKYRIPSIIRNEGIETFAYQRDESTDKTIGKLKNSLNFRKGFWIYTLERLLAFQQIHTKYSSDSLIHIESDVLLLKNFPFAKIKTLNKLHWLPYNDSRDVPAIIFSPSFQETNWLVKKIHEEILIDPFHTDMSILKTIKRKNGHKIEYFPIMDSRIGNLVVNPNVDGLNSINEILNSSNKFEGIFDGAAMGMWLLGHDPRNHYGITRIHVNDLYLKGDSYIDPSHFEYEIDEKDIIYIKSELGKREIFSLHVHSKNLKIFNINSSKELRHFIELSKNKKMYKRISIKISIQLIFSNLKSGTLTRYLAYSPPLVRLTKKLAIFYKKN